MAAAERASRGESFSLVDLADATGNDLASAKARWGRLGGSINAMRREVHEAPNIFEEDEKVDGLWRFTMPPGVRDAVLEQATDARRLASHPRP